MRHAFTLLCALSLGALTVLGAGNADKVRATNVFPGKLLSSLSMGGYTTTLNYNEKNQLVSASAFEDHVSFDYTAGEIDGFSYDLSMRQKDEDNTLDLYMRLNKQLFVEEAYGIEKEVGEKPVYEKWKFEYNSDGQLCKVSKTEEDEVITLTYTEGNITKVETVEKKYYTDTYEVYYYENIPNTSGFMMFDALLGAELDEMEITYYAGLLGKPTRCLPQGLYDSEDSETEIFKWTINSEGYPTQINIEGVNMSITWVEAASINGVENDVISTGQTQYFNINGMHLEQPQKGLNLVRTSDGKVTKVIIK